MKTVLHSYNYDLRDAGQALVWEALRETLSRTHPHCMESHGGGSHYMPDLDGQEIELDPQFLFSNQWNTTQELNLRLFDWALDYNPDKREYIKRGYYLDQTDEMKSARALTLVCGYCGKQEPIARGYKFCPHCLGSAYLKPEDLKLTRMRPADESGPPFKPYAELTDEETKWLMPLYMEAQTKGVTERDKARIAKTRVKVHEKATAAIKNAGIERDGFLWFLDRGMHIDNLIFYNHTGRFCWGWRDPLTREVAARMRELTTEFPFPLDIKE